MIPYGRQLIDEDDIRAVVEILNSDFLTTGPAVARFEKQFAEFVGAKHAIAVCNATAALHLSMIAAGVGDGDRVVTSPNTFLSSANAAAFVGATPDFVDIDPVTYNLCPGALEDSWQEDTKLVVAVDYAGQTPDLLAIAEVARQHGAVVIEDACHGVGGEFVSGNERYRVGSNPFADISTFSFHPVKTMTTGEGGMVVTNHDCYAEIVRSLRTHGVVREPTQFVGLGSSEFDEMGPWYYEMQRLGWNYRITDLQCGLGLSQLAKLPAFVQRRRQIVERYNEAFQGVPWLTTPGVRCSQDRDLISWHLYTVLIDFNKLSISRSQLMRELRELGIGTQVLYIPVYLQPWYREQFGYEPGKCPVAEKIYQQTLSLPLYPAMNDDEVELVIGSVKELLTAAS